ncbi:MAG: Co2+/Mg2+ efflux protein ApaG [Hyphomicrobiales bacterium]|nr:Co2+/Mg2+ efflux protein ApaG [Hyphomicrobiales bacterium]
MYIATTQQIQVTVEPSFVESESSPADGRYFWAYTIEIVNLGVDEVQLRARHWQITDANGRTEEVRGAGVVGKQPFLKPGECFSYTSGCPLPTSSGIMVGSYQMQKADGGSFSIDIPAFSLDVPNERRVMN